ncbi:hypothetical protein QTL86_07915 [Cellulosilyticum sp. ST5]|uniref:hypothetical protein n=1 Tax=Cellulosilyticum sp. ST5 TaxID=3055805 RepID=UPI0039779068
MALFVCKDIKDIKIQEIYIIGSLNGCQHNKDRLLKVGDTWCINLHLPDGIYFYKYVVNQYIKLNDPTSEKYALDEQNEMWSIVRIRDNQISNPVLKDTMHIQKYIITNRLWHDISENFTQKVINLKTDRKVCLGIKLQMQVGLHQITVLWYEPSMSLYHISEHTFYGETHRKEEFQTKWFCLDLSQKQREYPEGVWIIRVFINGYYKLQDYFRLSHEPSFKVR